MKKKSMATLVLVSVILGICVYSAYSNVTNQHFNPHVEFIREEICPMNLIKHESGEQEVYMGNTSISPEEEITFLGNLYSYWFGFAGNWNYSKIQTTDFHAVLKEITGGDENLPDPNARQEPFPWCDAWFGSPFANKGFERGAVIHLRHQLTEQQIEEVRKLIEEYLY